MPHIIVQTLALLVFHPQQTVYLSIYESGSKDATGDMCAKNTRMLLRCRPDQMQPLKLMLSYPSEKARVFNFWV